MKNIQKFRKYLWYIAFVVFVLANPITHKIAFAPEGSFGDEPGYEIFSPADDTTVNKGSSSVGCDGKYINTVGAVYRLEIFVGSTEQASVTWTGDGVSPFWEKNLTAPAGGWTAGVAVINLKRNGVVMASNGFTFE